MPSRSLRGLRINPEAFEKLSPAERDAVDAELRLVEGGIKRNPLLLYEPHPKQVEFHRMPHPPLRCFIGGNRCLAEGTLVRMADGSARPIESVQRGELVLGSNEEGVCFPVPVLRRFDNGPRTCYRFSFGKRRAEAEVVATADHRVAAFHEKGHRAVLPLALMDGTTRSRWSVQRATYLVEDGRPEPFAMLYGLLLGDGCTVNGRVSFACDDAEVLELLTAQCEQFGVGARQNPANPIQYYLSAGKTGKPNPLSTRIKELGMACYAHEKRLPDIADWNNESVAQLLAGLLVTDGSVWKASEGWRLGFTSVSKGLVEDVGRELAERFGVYGSTLLIQDRASKRRTEYSLTIGNYKSLERLSFALPAVAKLKKLRQALANWEGKKSDGARLRYRGREEVGVLPTYDLAVDHPDHLFVLANGMVVHNSGKTTSTMVDTIIQAVDRDVLPAHLRKYRKWDDTFYCRVITPDLTNTLEGVVLQKFREWCPKDQFRGSSFDRAWDKQLRTLHFKNGNWIQFFSNDQDLDKLGGAALHRVVYDESPRQDIRRESLMRLIDYGGEELFGLTPLDGISHFVYDEIYEPWERGALEDGRVVVVDMDDNPHLDPVAKERVLKGLSFEEREARKSGRFIALAGLIYPEFSKQRHVIPTQRELPKGVEVFCGIDPGIRHMCAVLYCYLDFEDRLVVFDEIAMEGATVHEVCREIVQRNAVWGVRPNWYVIDPAARNKATQTGRSDQQEFADNGIVTIPGQNAVAAGLNRVKERLQADRLSVMAHCEQLCGEFKRYRWRTENTRTENAAPPTPVKRDDHLLDALRYVCAQRPLTPERERQLPSDTYLDRVLRHSLKKLRLTGGRGAPDSGFGPGLWS